MSPRGARCSRILLAAIGSVAGPRGWEGRTDGASERVGSARGGEGTNENENENEAEAAAAEGGEG